jgi:hypothetical protein
MTGLGLREWSVVYDFLDESGSCRHGNGINYADKDSNGRTDIFDSEVEAMVGKKEGREGAAMRSSTT